MNARPYCPCNLLNMLLVCTHSNTMCANNILEVLPPGYHLFVQPYWPGTMAVNSLSVHRNCCTIVGGAAAWLGLYRAELRPSWSSVIWGQVSKPIRGIHGVGLSLIAEACVGRPLDKTEQLSAWEDPPLDAGSACLR